MPAPRSPRRSRRSPERPYVICHMVPSVDGRIVVDRWPAPRSLHAEYERTAAALAGDAWIIGRVSMEPYAGGAARPSRRSGRPVPRTDFIAPTEARSYAIAIDPSGKLRWASGDIDGEQAVTVLTESVSDGYLQLLRARGVSYLFGGRRRIDLPRVLRKLRARLGVRYRCEKRDSPRGPSRRTHGA